ncbi:MAG: EamA family transporter [Aeoliella sp.]
MGIGIAAIVLLAAFLHASWNALVKTSADKIVSISSIALVVSTAGFLVIPWVPLPDRASWICLGISTLLHFAYYLFLSKAYQYGDLSQVYPIARGLAPLLVTVGAIVCVGERLPLLPLLGVVMASAGIVSIVFLQESAMRRDPIALFFAVGTGVIIAGYTLADGVGVRLSGNPLAYIAWMFFLKFPVVPIALLMRRNQFVSVLRNEWKTMFGAGICCLLAYGMVVYAMTLASMAAVSALRESSVIIAALIGTFVLGEQLWRQRVAAAAVVAVGVALVTSTG